MSSTNEITVNNKAVIFAMAVEIILPFYFSLIWINHFKAKMMDGFFGVLGFLSSVTLESLILSLIVTKFVDKGSLIFYIFAGSFPGIFEETGKFLFLKYLYKTEKEKNISVMYGIGHGGAESIIAAFSLITNLVSQEELIKRGLLKESITFRICFMSIMERFFAIIIQISLSVFVYKSIKEKKIIYFLLAIIIHDGIDVFALLQHMGYIKSIFLIELIVGIYALILSFYTCNLYNNIVDDKKEKLPENKQKIQ